MKKLWRIVTNKFVVTAVIFGVWMAFFDQNDWGSQQQRKQDLQAAEENIAYLNGQIGIMENEYDAMLTSPYALEKYAREHYRMKRDNEDLYIVE